MRNQLGKPARELSNVLSVSCSVPPHLLLAAMRDGASVNSVAMCTISIVYPNVLDVRYISHTIVVVGGKFKTPVLSSFVSFFISLFLRFGKEQMGRAMGSYSKTRRWSRWEVMQQVMVQFGKVVTFLTNLDLGSSATRSHLLEIVQDPEKIQLLRTELKFKLLCQ